MSFENWSHLFVILLFFFELESPICPFWKLELPTCEVEIQVLLFYCDFPIFFFIKTEKSKEKINIKSLIKDLILENPINSRY